MKVLNLQCGVGHGFEGWFGSEDDFQSQRSRGLVECPLCGDHGVEKLPSAPRLNLSSVRDEPRKPTESAIAPEQALQLAWLQAVRQVMANTEDVGQWFAEEARRIHYGEVPERGIRGQASAQEAGELLEEGITILPLPIPDVLKEPLQ